MSCATATIKYLVFIFNTLCALLGIGTIVVSSLALKTATDEGRLVLIFLIVLASVVFTVSFMGCCGAIRESTCMTWTYAVFLLILIISNCVLMFGYLPKLDGETHARKELDGAWAKQLNGTESMSFYQQRFSCCGKLNAQDYVNANLIIPSSCYLSGDTSNPKNLFQEGCLKSLGEVYEAAESLVVYFGWVTLGIEVAAFVCACILAITFRNQQRRSRY